MTSYRFKWSRSVNYFKLPELSRSCLKQIIYILKLSELIIKPRYGEFLDLHLKSVQENSVYKEPCVLKEN